MDDICESLQQELLDARQSIAALEEEVSTLRAALVNAEAALENAIRERADEISLKNENEAYKKKIELKDARIKALKEERDAMSMDVVRATRQNTELQQELNESADENTKLKQMIDAWQVRCTQLESDVDSESSRRKTAEDRLSVMVPELENTKIELERWRAVAKSVRDTLVNQRGVYTSTYEPSSTRVQ